ncbi:ATP-binding protein [Sulfurimonas sp. NWX79]|uniref:sensor histidine kinase n=1 Tax=Sulfurimonas sp. NWX79 TaxID=2925412 RepID=UPI003204A53C
MLKFHQIVLRKFLTLFLSLFLIVGGIVYYWTYEFYIASSKDALTQDIELLSLTINNDTNLDKLALDVKKRLHLRLTLIDENGNILAESHKDKTTMDNHKYRDEIMQAREDGIGYKIRHSKTLDKDLLYVVKKFTIHNKIIYIRLAQEINGIQNEIFSLGLKILAAIIIFFIAVLMASYKVNKEIEYETNKIVDFLKSLTKKKKSTYISSDYSQEFAYITNLLTKVSQIIVKKEKQKSKYTQRLQESNKQKDDIISAISHEFKNPIAVVNGYSQTLLDDTDINPNIRKKFLEKIYKNGVKLSELIDTLRLSIKLDSGQQDLKKRKINLYKLLSECVDNIKINYHNRETIISGDKDITIEADETLFGIVACNLIENAFKYSEDEVHINITKDSFEVVDTGIGISKKDLENITQKFYRAHTNKWNNSLGLGLFLVNNIVNLHGFKLEVESIENEGSTFRIKF